MREKMVATSPGARCLVCNGALRTEKDRATQGVALGCSGFGNITTTPKRRRRGRKSDGSSCRQTHRANYYLAESENGATEHLCRFTDVVVREGHWQATSGRAISIPYLQLLMGRLQNGCNPHQETSPIHQDGSGQKP